MTTTTQFPCPHCGYTYTKLRSTNRTKSGTEVKRTRRCLKCNDGFVTYEVRSTDYTFLRAARRLMAADLIEVKTAHENQH